MPKQQSLAEFRAQQLEPMPEKEVRTLIKSVVDSCLGRKPFATKTAYWLWMLPGLDMFSEPVLKILMGHYQTRVVYYLFRYYPHHESRVKNRRRNEETPRAEQRLSIHRQIIEQLRPHLPQVEECANWCSADCDEYGYVRQLTHDRIAVHFPSWYSNVPVTPLR